MSMRFEWHTAEDGEWEGVPPAAPEGPAPRARRRRLIFAAAALLVVMLTAAGAYLRLQRQVETRTAQMAAAVLEAHRLVLEAAAAQDYDLFAALQFDPRSPAANLALSLLERDLFLDRPSLGLTADVETTLAGAAAAEVELSPDLAQATVIHLQPYMLAAGSGPAETVWLERRYSYRLAADNWALDAPASGESFWGAWENTEYGRLALIIPRRDADIGRRLGPRFASLLDELCLDRRIDCPDDLRLELRLAVDPNSLLRLNEDYLQLYIRAGFSTFGAQPYQLTLPAPTLVGRPVDAAGEEALYRGYAGWVAGVMISQLASWPHADIAAQLAEWDLQAPARPVLPLPRPARVAERPPVAFPPQDVYTLCGGQTALSLLRYAPRINRWSNDTSSLAGIPIDQIPLYSGAGMIPLPDDSGALLSAFLAERGSPRWVTYLWRDGNASVLFESDIGYALIPASYQPGYDRDARFLQFYLYTESSSPMSPSNAWVTLDLLECLAGNCELRVEERITVWSPDGRHALSWRIEDDQQADLILVDADGVELALLGRGYQPVWQDAGRFAFIRLDDDRRPSAVVAGRVPDPTSRADWHEQLLFDAREIVDALGLDAAADIGVDSVVPDPYRPGRWYATVHSRTSAALGEAQVLAFDETAGRLWLLASPRSDAYIVSPPRLRPGGHHLLVVTANPISSSFSALVHLIPLDGEPGGPATQPLASFPLLGDDAYDWSANGEWLAIRSPGELRLIAPDAGYEFAMPFEVDVCGPPIWLNSPEEAE